LSKFTNKDDFLAEVRKERDLFEDLLAQIPKNRKNLEVTDGMTIKDFLAHRTEWGRMMIRWYTEAAEGKTPAVPTEQFKWNQLKELNADIHRRFAKTSLVKIEAEFAAIHEKLYRMIEKMTDEELFTKKHYGFTGSSDLVTYLNSSTASHYRSARRHIAKWWKAR